MSENLSTLSVARLNELMVLEGHEEVILTATYGEINASDEHLYSVTHNSTFADGRTEEVLNHVFVNFDLQGDVKLSMADIDEGELNLRVAVEVSMARDPDNITT
jgi:hypothetical protein|tara:strand:+ start:1766 stop:2077 length:312 start_codon:yes stop_codon:yes gene_type:complete